MLFSVRLSLLYLNPHQQVLWEVLFVMFWWFCCTAEVFHSSASEQEVATMWFPLLLLFVFISELNAIEQVPIQDGKKDSRPNIVVILTDDQDLHMDSVDYMPLLRKHIIDKGTFYKRHYCSTAICCPSRVTLWTGRNAHNTNVTDVFPPYGSSPHPTPEVLSDSTNRRLPKIRISRL